MNYKRKELKTKAKQVLRKSYFKALIISIILGVVSAGSLSVLFVYNPFSQSSLTGGSDASNSVDSFWDQVTDIDWSEQEAAIADAIDEAGGVIPEGEWQGDIDELIDNIYAELIRLAFMIIMAVGVFGLILRIFVFNHLVVGATGYFVDTAQDLPSGFWRLKHGFRKGAYLNIAVVMLLREIFISLWSLLLIIPGIVKSLSYAMVPYLLAENPSMRYKDALKTSAAMMRGYRWRLIVLQLSFFWWILLGTLLVGVGQLFVWPYINAALAQFYIHVKENAAQTVES